MDQKSNKNKQNKQKENYIGMLKEYVGKKNRMMLISSTCNRTDEIFLLNKKIKKSYTKIGGLDYFKYCEHYDNYCYHVLHILS